MISAIGYHLSEALSNGSARNQGVRIPHYYCNVFKKLRLHKAVDVAPLTTINPEFFNPQPVEHSFLSSSR